MSKVKITTKDGTTFETDNSKWGATVPAHFLGIREGTIDPTKFDDSPSVIAVEEPKKKKTPERKIEKARPLWLVEGQDVTDADCDQALRRVRYLQDRGKIVTSDNLFHGNTPKGKRANLTRNLAQYVEYDLGLTFEDVLEIKPRDGIQTYSPGKDFDKAVEKSHKINTAEPEPKYQGKNPEDSLTPSYLKPLAAESPFGDHSFWYVHPCINRGYRECLETVSLLLEDLIDAGSAGVRLTDMPDGATIETERGLMFNGAVTRHLGMMTAMVDMKTSDVIQVLTETRSGVPGSRVAGPRAAEYLKLIEEETERVDKALDLVEARRKEKS